MTSAAIRVFLCHASEDKPLVREVAHWLRESGYRTWLDEDNLLPGQEWEREIPKAVKESDIILVILSRRSCSKRGYIQKEIRLALSAAELLPEGATFIVPLRTDGSEVPEQLSKYHWADYRSERGKAKLLEMLASYGKPANIASFAKDIRDLGKEITKGIRDLAAGLQMSKDQVSDLASLHLLIGKNILEIAGHNAAYGSFTIDALANQLKKEFGDGFSASRLRHMRKLYLMFPNSQIIPRNLTASHLHVLADLVEEDERMWYMMKAANLGWSVRTLKNQIASELFKRALGMSRTEGLHPQDSAVELLRDPYVLEFLGLPPKSKPARKPRS